MSMHNADLEAGTNSQTVSRNSFHRDDDDRTLNESIPSDRKTILKIPVTHRRRFAKNILPTLTSNRWSYLLAALGFVTIWACIIINFQEDEALYQSANFIQLLDEDYTGPEYSNNIWALQGSLRSFDPIERTLALPIGTVGVHWYDSFSTDITMKQSSSHSVWTQPSIGYPFEKWQGNLLVVANFLDKAQLHNATSSFGEDINKAYFIDSLINWRITTKYVDTCSNYTTETYWLATDEPCETLYTQNDPNQLTLFTPRSTRFIVDLVGIIPNGAILRDPNNIGKRDVEV
ncbi:hypothetical protein M408DRAFT_311260 [Serendipita vermifera MAFF 305830]|uniref:Uncharacterized protein n=1 Tax=Serendipita vermifera MAFF 305830 TaxID=933852 RepID=A0A0C3B7D9_SERVB|nr:hypothetical protein M408DRAFT_311260 [Serendipita vermifera MAFF 305830]